MFEVNIHFRDARDPVRFLAEDLAAQLDTQAGGLQRLTYKVAGDQEVSIYLNPNEIASIVPTVVEQGEDAERNRASGVAPIQEPSYLRGLLRKEPPPPAPELERQILEFLIRFRKVTLTQLTDRIPILRHFEEQDHVIDEVETFFADQFAASDRLHEMERKGLVTGMGHSGYSATEKGAELVGLRFEPEQIPTVCYTHDYASKIVSLFQSIASIREDAAWVTDLELANDGARARREGELNRKLPAGRRRPNKYWPNTPDGILVLKESGTVAAVGLDPTSVTGNRWAFYENLLGWYSKEPTLDRALFFFERAEAMYRVQELAAKRYGRDDFFVFSNYPPDNLPELLA